MNSVLPSNDKSAGKCLSKQRLHALTMNLLLFRTDIKTKKKVKIVKPMLVQHPRIKEWSIDIEDIDNVLRIEVTGNLDEKDIMCLVKKSGFYCEILTD